MTWKAVLAGVVSVCVLAEICQAKKYCPNVGLAKDEKLAADNKLDCGSDDKCKVSYNFTEKKAVYACGECQSTDACCMDKASTDSATAPTPLSEDEWNAAECLSCLKSDGAKVSTRIHARAVKPGDKRRPVCLVKWGKSTAVFDMGSQGDCNDVTGCCAECSTSGCNGRNLSCDNADGGFGG